MICVVIPTYNESENLHLLLPRVLGLGEEYHALVVDDGSPDGTADYVRSLAAKDSRAHLIARSGKRGYAPASRDGIAWALDNDFTHVCSMDADLSHDPSVLPRMVEVIDGGADVVIGSRYVAQGALQTDWGWLRRAVSQSGSAYARVMLGVPVQDCTSGFRCYRASALAAVDLGATHSEGYSFLIEALAMLAASGAKLAEVPITYVDRARGESKISRHIILEAFVRTTALGISGLPARVARALRRTTKVVA